MGAVAAKREYYEEADQGKIKRMTVELPENLYDNLQALSAKTKASKKKLLREALKTYLVKQGLRPEKPPKITVSYAGEKPAASYTSRKRAAVSPRTSDDDVAA